MTHGHLVRMALKVRMISATGKASGKAAGRASAATAFTLIEIVLVLGLMALAAAIVITNFAAMADRSGSQTSEERLQAAVHNARFLAASERSAAALRFDKASGSLQILQANQVKANFPLDERFNTSGPAEMRFYLVPPAEGLGPLPDAASTRLASDHVTFAADRSSNPFVVEIDVGSGTVKRLVFDPFSSLQITRP